jgi:serine/threonine protein kinase/Tol biopolymer transport system component
MSTARWSLVQEIFEDAHARAPDEQAAFIADACAGDDGLREEVLSLLAASERTGDFLAVPAIDHLAREVAADGRSLRAGERVGVYVIDQLLGSGGGGEVWRARDERLGRDVAIKVLPPQFRNDGDRVRRFAEEARAAGALSDPNILVVHHVGEHHGAPFLVTECLDGQSLRSRLRARPVSVHEAIEIAIGIARGLAAAHGRGIVHRDLKPDNVFLTASGGVKILDFGLATLHAELPAAAGADGSVADVLTGTAAYMAPEQIANQRVDARADLFALGVTMHEMLSGHRPFSGASMLEVLQAVLTADPPSADTLNARVTPPLAAIVNRLLKKSPDGRFQSAADVAWALEQLAHPQPVAAASGQRQEREDAVRKSRSFTAMGGLLAALALGLGAGWMLAGTAWHDPKSPPLAAFTWPLPAGLSLDSAPEVSPDGLRIAFTAMQGGTSRLFVRDLSTRDPVAVTGSEGARHPFWAPDSRSLGFFARGKLMKVSLPAGAPTPLADARDGRGGAWSTSGTIVFAPDILESALLKVDSNGGAVEPATQLDRSRGENNHRWPRFLPDGIHFLYYGRSSDDQWRGVYLDRTDRAASFPHTLLLRSDSEAVFVPGSSSNVGDFLTVNDGRIEVRRFDAARLAFEGDPKGLDLGPAGPTGGLPSMFSASSGLLALAGSTVPLGARVSSALRTGEDLRAGEVDTQNWPRLSPDGKSLAIQRVDTVRGTPDIWIEDLERGVRLRATTSREADQLPVWSPDGTRLAYILTDSPPRTPGPMKLVVAPRDGTGVLQTMPCPDTYCETTDWTRDGDVIVNVRGPRGADVWAVPTVAGQPARPLLQEPYVERDARVSPHGRWVSYVTEENGRPEIAVRTIKGGVARALVSGAGGDQPVWRRDGQELFFVNPEGRLCSVAVRERGDGAPALSVPRVLDFPAVGFGHFGTQYDVSPDGNRIYFMQRTDAQPPRQIEIVMGWRGLLDAR